MKMINCLLILISFIVVSTGYVNNEEIFLNANKRYHEQQFQDALQLYDSLPQQGWAVYYNKACCFFHEGNFVQAIKYWQKALQSGGHSHKDLIETYCLRAAQHLSIQYEYDWKNRLYLLTQKIPQFFWQLLFLFLLYTIILLFIGFRRMSSGIMVLLACLIVFTMSIMIFRYYYDHRKLVIVVQPSSIYAGRNSSFSQVNEIPKGALVCASDENKEWLKVCYRGKVGWIESSEIEFISWGI